MGYDSECKIRRDDIFRRQTDGIVKSYEKIFPSTEEGSLIDNHEGLPKYLHRSYTNSKVDSFFNEY